MSMDNYYSLCYCMHLQLIGAQFEHCCYLLQRQCVPNSTARAQWPQRRSLPNVTTRPRQSKDQARPRTRTQESRTAMRTMQLIKLTDIPADIFTAFLSMFLLCFVLPSLLECELKLNIILGAFLACCCITMCHKYALCVCVCNIKCLQLYYSCWLVQVYIAG